MSDEFVPGTNGEKVRIEIKVRQFNQNVRLSKISREVRSYTERYNYIPVDYCRV